MAKEISEPKSVLTVSPDKLRKTYSWSHHFRADILTLMDLDLLDQKRAEQIRPHLHKFLRVRLAYYLTLAILLAGFVVYNSYQDSISGLYSALGVIIGICIGFFITRIHKISWDEKIGKVVGRFDLYGLVLLALLILFQIFRENIIRGYIDETDVTTTGFAVLAGIMYGRVLGIRGSVVRVLKERKKI